MQISNPTKCSFENGKYLASIIEHTVIKHDETITEKQLFQQLLMKKV